MALSKEDAILYSIYLGKDFILSFEKIYDNPKSKINNRFIDSMDELYNQIKIIILKDTYRPLNNNELYDWFFTAGNLLTNYFENPTDNKINKYNEFINYILQNIPINIAINNIL